MHTPENMEGATYVELVAAVSILLSKNLHAREAFILSEFLQAVGYQMQTIAAFKELDERRRPPPPPPPQPPEPDKRAVRDPASKAS